jgi:hypothetical protein
VCFDASRPPPKKGLPRNADRMTLSNLLEAIKVAFYERNVPKQIFAESDAEGDKTAELEELAARDPDLFDRGDDAAE